MAEENGVEFDEYGQIKGGVEEKSAVSNVPIEDNDDDEEDDPTQVRRSLEDLRSKLDQAKPFDPTKQD